MHINVEVPEMISWAVTWGGVGAKAQSRLTGRRTSTLTSDKKCAHGCLSHLLRQGVWNVLRTPGSFAPGIHAACIDFRDTLNTPSAPKQETKASSSPWGTHSIAKPPAPAPRSQTHPHLLLTITTVSCKHQCLHQYVTTEASATASSFVTTTPQPSLLHPKQGYKCLHLA